MPAQSLRFDSTRQSVGVRFRSRLRERRCSAIIMKPDGAVLPPSKPRKKAIKALFQKLGMDAWGHTLTALIGNLPPDVQTPAEMRISPAG